ncbi:putative acyl-activating enzyme 19 [Nicotiana attenuata]|uniref:Acyl-activating enzyme 19 n=1 Tax=Nicotiana attenuata TaxID=49451 RepID=A0A314LEU4_NICAT|nr:putative acyl-activating enzyme 19 [Nicotiana attenuata]
MVSYNKLSACCISHEFYKVATTNPNKIAVIQACGGLKIAKEFQLFCTENGDGETREKFEEFVSSKTTSVNPPVYEGDECFTYSDVLSAVDSLSSRLHCILDGGDDPNLLKPSSVNMHHTANNCSSKGQSILGSSDQGLKQYKQLHKTYCPRIVGIYMEPSVEYIVAVLSVLRCGEAFLPLDPSWQNERVLLVTSSSKASLIVGYGSSVGGTCHQLDKLQWLIDKGSYPVFCMSMEDFIPKKFDSLLGWPCESERLRSFCYLMYTSGSTGKPKGVCGTEVGLLNRFLWMQESYPFQKEEILLFKTSISFIDHLQEFLGSILANCTLVIPPFNQLKDNIFCVVNLLQEYSISRLVAVPSLIRVFLPALQSIYYSTVQISLKLVVLSGEVFDMSLWKMLVKLLPLISILNLYGSTEVSGDCTYFDCKWLPQMLEQDAPGSVPIGVPIGNCDVVLVGENSPDEGEICVSGSCVAAGYFCHPSIFPLDNVELRQEVADAESAKNEMKCYFRTGDFGRKLSDGNLVCIGRKDRTVKISGQRIALEEVESVLREHQEVADAAVVSCCVQGDILLLEAYLLLKQKESNLEFFRSSIRCWIASKLPPVMVPARFYFVESFPVSSSGKVDYKNLATSAASEAGNCIEIEETQDIDLINVIRKAFSDALMVVDKISLDDDFFEMGGNSLSAAYVSYNLGINMKDLYTFPTPLKLQKAILHKKVSSSRELRADALVGVNSKVQGKSKLPSNKSWMPGLDSSTSLSLTSDYPIKRLKTDSDLYIDPDDVNGRDMNNSTMTQVSCSYSRCNKVRHDTGCEGYHCRSMLSWEVPRDKRGFMRERWMVYMESCVDASPLVVFKERSAYLFIGAHSHKFFCIDATSGLVLWEVKLQGRVESSAAILHDFSQVVIGCYDGNIYFLNFSNGIPCWNFQTHGEVQGRPDYILACKLRMLKGKLKEWNGTNHGNFEVRKTQLLSSMAEMDVVQETRNLPEDELLQKASMFMKLEDIAKNEEIAWRQRSRVLWLKQGDRNTIFFHRMANAHRRNNTIDKLEVNGVTVENPETIKGEILSFYQKLYTETEEWRPEVVLADCPCISESEKQWLQRSFEEDEVCAGVKLCASDKAPGPDGYTMGFFHSCWDIVKEDVMQTLRNIHKHEFFEKSFNASYIALIPKKIGARELRDFRPISLIGSVYKIISKVLTERLKTVISKLVDRHQMAFIKGRQIMDATLVANECVDSRLKMKTPGILCKLDIEKAYDHVSWVFLLKMLKSMGFGRKWIKWMLFCISSVRFSVLINGSPEGFFPSHRGLRQGDPLSPFLFLIAMEGLNNMIKVANNNRWMTGFKVASSVGGMEADSGLHVNWRKSLIFPVNEVTDIQRLTDVLGCTVGTLPTTYLGNRRKTSFWNDNWLGHGPLKDLFSDMKVLSLNNEATVEDSWDQHGWTFNFRRELNDWELPRFTEFLNALDQFKGTTVEEDRVKSQPIVDKERHLVWCGSHDHNLYALDYKNHCCVYKIRCGGSIFGAPALDEVHEKLYVASTSGRVTALFVGALPFDQIWVQELGVPIFASLSINPSSGNVICCMVDGSVVSLGAEGSVIWKVSTAGPIFAGPCISRALTSQVLVCSRDGSVYSFDLENGDLFWKHDIGHPITSSAYVDEHLLLAYPDSSLSQSARLICVCSSSGSVRVLQVSLNSDGANQPCNVVREFVRYELGGDIFSSPVMIGGEIFVGCRDDYVHCIRVLEEIPI